MISRVSALRGSANVRQTSSSGKKFQCNSKATVNLQAFAGDIIASSPYVRDVANVQRHTNKWITYSNLYSDALELAESPRKLLSKDFLFNQMIKDMEQIPIASLDHQQLLSTAELYTKAIVCIRQNTPTHRNCYDHPAYMPLLDGLFELAKFLEFTVKDDTNARIYYDEAAFHGHHEAQEKESGVDPREVRKAIKRAILLDIQQRPMSRTP